LRNGLSLHILERRLRWERRERRRSLRYLCILDRRLRWRWRERWHRRDITSCLLKVRRSWRCRIATMGNTNGLLRRGRLEVLEGEGGETYRLLLLLIPLIILLLLLGFGTAACHG
jgi:hypothetical protein